MSNAGQFKSLNLDEVKKRLPTFIKLDESTYKATNIKAKFIDDMYGEFWMMPYAVFRGQTHPTRGIERTRKKKSLSLDEVKKRLPSSISIIESTYVNASSYCVFVDEIHGEFKAKPTEILQGKRKHPNRNKEDYIHPQQKLYIEGLTAKQWCEKHKVPYNTIKGIWHLGEDYLRQWRDNYTTARSNLEVFVLQKTGIQPYNRYPNSELKFKPDFKVTDSVFLNVDGLYWHSEKHKDKKYHYNLRKSFLSHNYKILQFTSDQVFNKWPIVSSVISSKTNNNKTIYARKCNIQEVSPKESRQFLEQNHIMGYTKSRAVGLYHENNLVAIMSFSIRKNNIMKIERFCSVTNTNITGGLSKLISFLTKKFEVNEVQSWVDLRYGSGESLTKLGFKHLRTTLGWKWTDGVNTYNRLKCRANMDSRRLTEKQHAQELGWVKIYDAGQALFVKELKNV